jgi:hypothetical protein
MSMGSYGGMILTGENLRTLSETYSHTMPVWPASKSRNTLLIISYLTLYFSWTFSTIFTTKILYAFAFPQDVHISTHCSLQHSSNTVFLNEIPSWLLRNILNVSQTLSSLRQSAFLSALFPHTCNTCCYFKV